MVVDVGAGVDELAVDGLELVLAMAMDEVDELLDKNNKARTVRHFY